MALAISCLIWCFDRCISVMPTPLTSVPNRGSHIAMPILGPPPSPPPNPKEAAPRIWASREVIAVAWAVGKNSIGNGWHVSVADADV
jgi:hypothetical protein